jgi:murein DD-endopeptidase MepM/ murein hydrolase activator NlpD
VLVIALSAAIYGALVARPVITAVELPSAAAPAPGLSHPITTPETFAETPPASPTAVSIAAQVETVEEPVAAATEEPPEDQPEPQEPVDAETEQASLESPDAGDELQALGVTPVPTVAALATPTRTPTPRPTASPTPFPTPRLMACEASDSLAFCIYTVQEGDTLSGIAARFQLESKHVLGWELLVASNKPDLTSVDDYIQPGQKLRIPTASGLVHTVILGETVGDLADIFDVTSAEIIEANKLADKDLLAIGQVLLIPNPGRTSAPPPPDPTPEPPPPPPPPPPPSGAAPGPGSPPRGASSSGFIWPITARAVITSYFGPRHPLGIDLGLAHARGSAIVAAASGRVIFAGGNACCSYGLYVIVDHGNGLKTLYAHLSRLDVRAGQWVDRGDSLGPSGSTGYSTGPHLHFEVHRNGVRVNPISYLP